jgi:uncharacterized protein involved in outer membrane biogenesis
LNVFLKTAGAVVVALVAAVLIGPSFVDWNRYKSQITQPIEELTGRKLEIVGDVSFAVLPAPAFSAEGLHFANIEGGRAADLASAESLDIRVAFLPLIGGRIQVESIALNNPVLALEVLTDGRANWVFDTKVESDAAGDASDRKSLIDISFEEVVIENGSVSYDDAGAERSHYLEQVSAIVSASSLDGPFSMAGTATVQQVPLSLEVLIGNLKSSRAVPISFSIGFDDRTAKLGFAGWASEPGPEARLNGRLTAEGGNLAETIERMTAVAEVSLEKAFLRPLPLQAEFSVEAQVVASAREGRLRNLALQLGDSAATGSFHMASETGGEFEGELNIPSIQLDSWLAKDDENVDLATEDAAAPMVGATKGTPDFSLPTDVSGTFKISVGGVNYQGGVVRQLGIALRMGDAHLGVESATALLPGGSSVDLTGVLAADAGKPRFSGRLKGSSDNLRGLLTWLDVDVATVPFDRLTRLAYSSSIDASPDVFQVYGVDMTVDTLRAKGGVSVALQERTSIGLDLTIDALDLDAYIGTPTGTSATSSESKAAGSGGPSPVIKLKQQLAILDDFDANLELNVGQLLLQGTEVTNLRVDGGVYQGEITLKELSVGDYLGAGGVLAGSMRELSRKPFADLRLDFDLRTPDALKNIVGNILPKTLGQLGAGKGNFSLKGDEGRVAVDLNAGFFGTEVSVKGAVVAPTSVPAVDLTLSVANNSTANLIKQFALPLDTPGAPDDGPIAVSLTTRGKIDVLNLKTAIDVGGASFSIDGKAENLFIDPSYDFKLDLKGDDLKKLVRGLGIDFRPAAANLGGVDLTLKVSGDHTRASLNKMKGALGPVKFSGDARIQLTGDRPRVEGTLKTSEVIVDLFLPADASTAGADAGGAQGRGKSKDRWSKEPFDLAALRDIDGELRFEAPGVVVGTYDFRSVKAVLALQDGIATVNPFNARLFDGDAVLDVSLAASKIPTLDLQLSLTNADVSQTMLALADLEAVTGRAGVSGEFNAAGRNQFDMIASLTGGARISAREGEIRGIDLQGLSERLKNLDNLSDVLDVVTGSMSGGKTAYRSIEGAVEVAKGVARATDVRTDIDAVDTTVSSEMDLVNWTMDTSALFQLSDHPKAPPVGIDLRGPIDGPRRDLKTRKLESYLTKRLGAAVLKNLVGKKSKASDPAGDPAAPSQAVEGSAPVVSPKAPAPEDVLRDLLKNLP